MKILYENDVDFQVAPYMAWPQVNLTSSPISTLLIHLQLVYLEKKGFVDAICGNSELFLFEVEKVITHLNVTPGGSFTWVNRPRLLTELGFSNDMFIDACMLSGSEICRPFPPLEGPRSSNPHAFLNSVELIKRTRNASAVFRTHPELESSGYVDKYRKARAAITHHVILTDEGKAEPLHFASAPGDVHEFIGHRLPEELYFYLSRGMIGPQVLDMLATGELVVVAPFDNGDSEEYRKFLDALNPLRLQALSLVAQPLNFWWLSKEVSVHYWFDKKNQKKLVPKEVIPSPYELPKKWNVKEKILRPELEKSDVSSFRLALDFYLYFPLILAIWYDIYSSN